MLFSGLTVDGPLVLLNFINNILITVADAVLAETPEPVLVITVRLGKACISNEAVPFSEIERYVGECEGIVFGEVVNVLGFEFRDDREPATKFGDLDRRSYQIDPIDILQYGCLLQAVLVGIRLILCVKGLSDVYYLFKHRREEVSASTSGINNTELVYLVQKRPDSSHMAGKTLDKFVDRVKPVY